MTDITFGHGGGALPYSAFYGNLASRFKSKKTNMEDLDIILALIHELKHLLPLRSGRLQDTVFNTLGIERVVGKTTGDKRGEGFQINITYEYPNERPQVMEGNVKHTGEEGYGEVYVPANKEVAQQLVRYSKSGLSAVYSLNDPQAVQEPDNEIRAKIFEKIVEHISEWFSNFEKITAKVEGF